MDVTLNIPDHISAEDAQAVIAAFMAAQAAATPAPVEQAESVATDEPATSYEADEQDEQDTTPEPDRSYVSVPSDGGIPSVTMSVGAHEGGIYGDVAALRMAEEVTEIRNRLDEYRNAAEEAALDPDRKRPPRAEPSLVDAAVRQSILKTHHDTMTYMMDDGENGMSPGWNDRPGRINRSNEEQEHIGFVLSGTPRRTPHSMCHNHNPTNAWGIIDRIADDYGVRFTRAQVRASVKRLTDSGFLTEDGMCGKSARYRLTDISKYTKNPNA